MPIYKDSGVLAENEGDLTPEYLGMFGRAVAGMIAGTGTVVVGREDREDLGGLESALAEGLAAGGGAVAEVGAVPRAVAGFARRMLRGRCALYVTAGDESQPRAVHLLIDKAPASRGRMEELRRAIESGDLPEKSGGEIDRWDEDIAEEYIEWVCACVPETPKKDRLGGVFLAPEGVMAQAAGRLAQARAGLSVEVVPQQSPVRLSWTGALPPEIDALGAQVRESGAAFGALIGAAGAVARFVDENGKAISPDGMGLILLRTLFADLKGKKVVLDVRARQELANEVKKGGGEAVFALPGEERLVERMSAEGAVVALGADGTVCFPEIQGADALYMSLRLAETLRSSGDALSALRLGQKLSPVIGDLAVPCRPEWFHAILSRIRSNYPLERQVELNGVRVRLDEGWAVALPLEDEERMLYRFGGKDLETAEAIAAEFIDSAVEIRAKARRLAGLPEAPQHEETYEDYGKQF